MTAEIITLDQFIKGLPDNYLHCRDVGHHFGDFTAKYVKDGRYYERVLRCSSCTTGKMQLLDEEGYLISHKSGAYRYPPGYLATHVDLGSPYANRAAYRLEATRRKIGLAKPRRRRAA